jgi:hypothetical protein
MPTSDLYLWCLAAGLPEPDPECAFLPGRRFRADLAWPEYRVIAEREGGFFGHGKACPACGRKAAAGHGAIRRVRSDMEKYNLAGLAGWLVVRYLPEDELKEATLELIKAALRARGWGG